MAQKMPGQARAPGDHFRLTLYDLQGRLAHYGAFTPHSPSVPNATVASLTQSASPQIFLFPVFCRTPLFMAPVRVTLGLSRDGEY
jgi:hypothetical protein